VTVPASAWAEEEETLTVIASTLYAGVNYEDQETATAVVAPRFVVHIVTDPTRSERNPQVFKISLKNDGNANVSFKVKVTNQASLTKQGVHTEFDRSETKVLGLFKSDYVNLTVRCDPWAGEGEHPISITVVTVKENGDVVKEDLTTVSIVVDHLNNDVPFYVELTVTIVIVLTVVALVVKWVLKRRRARARKALKKKKKQASISTKK